MTLSAWREVMAADVESIVLVTQAALPLLLQRGGGVVNVASVAGLGGDPGMTIYNAAKGAVVNLTRSMAVEYAGRRAMASYELEVRRPDQAEVVAVLRLS
jgi:meso-butanediol dehydrogenase / (S,S)-butanediol dehydrogenase / diacetyl reductase